MLKISFPDVSSKITNSRLYPYLAGANELTGNFRTPFPSNIAETYFLKVFNVFMFFNAWPYYMNLNVADFHAAKRKQIISNYTFNYIVQVQSWHTNFI